MRAGVRGLVVGLAVTVVGLLVVTAGLLVLVGAAPAALAAGPWTWPLDGPRGVARPFAPGPTPYSPGHYGADLAAPAGAVVRAVGAGQVSYAGLIAGRGVVVVSHGALRTTYEPVQASVRVGQQVAGGAVLGRLGTGHDCRPAGAGCLHLGLRRGAAYLDPLRLFGGPVRLLPVDGGGAVARSVGGSGVSRGAGAAPGQAGVPGPAALPGGPGPVADGSSSSGAVGTPPGAGASPPAASADGALVPGSADRALDPGRAGSAAPASWQERVAQQPGRSVAAAAALLLGLALVRGPGPRRPTPGHAGDPLGSSGPDEDAEAGDVVVGRQQPLPPPIPPVSPVPPVPPVSPVSPVPAVPGRVTPGPEPAAASGAAVVALDEERRRRRSG